MVGEATLEAMKIYPEARFGIIDEYADPRNHLGAELKFMSFLCYREMEAWKDEKSGTERGVSRWRKSSQMSIFSNSFPNFAGELKRKREKNFSVLLL